MTYQPHLLKRNRRIPADIPWLCDKSIKNYSLRTKDRLPAIRLVREMSFQTDPQIRAQMATYQAILR